MLRKIYLFRKRKTAIILLALTFIILGLTLLVISEYNITYNKSMLAKEVINTEKFWRFEGALQWWTNTQEKIINPVITVLLSIAFLFFTVQLVYDAENYTK